MQIKEMRLSFVQFECVAEPLRSKEPPAIPFGFLLDSGKFKTEFERALKKFGSCRAPWHTGYGRRFWSSYIKKEYPELSDYWDRMVPLQYYREPVLTAAWLSGNARARAYLYPWGIGALVDMSITSALDIDDAVRRFVGILNADQMEITLNGNAEQGPLPVLLRLFSDYIRGIAFGAGIGGTRSDLFTVVTILDAEGADPNTAVADGGPLHKNLNGFARDIKNWKNVKPGPIANNTLGTRPAAAGSILYGTRRGRVVWYPESFRSAGEEFKNTLRCYHQNLTAATLQTEALCMLAKDAAALIGAGKAHGTWAPNYDQCSHNAAGLIGRMSGGVDTYGSHSIPHQIDKTYQGEVKALRGEYGMTP